MEEPVNEPRPGDDEAALRRRLWWRSRRGLRELDLLLLPFVEEVYPTLDGDAQAVYLRLLEEEDTELLLWLTGRAEPLDPAVHALVGRIRAHGHDHRRP